MTINLTPIREIVARNAPTPGDYARAYELRSDDGAYTPTESEQMMIEDAILGFLEARRDLALGRNNVLPLAEALMPFAEAGYHDHERDLPDDTVVRIRIGNIDDYTVTLGDLRRAREVLRALIEGASR